MIWGFRCFQKVVGAGLFNFWREVAEAELAFRHIPSIEVLVRKARITHPCRFRQICFHHAVGRQNFREVDKVSI